MYKKISVTLADGKPGEMECLSNGATAIRYRQTFRSDLLMGISDLMKAIGTDNLVKMQEAEKRRKLQEEQQKHETEEANETDEERKQKEQEMTKEEMEVMISILSSGKLAMVSELAYVMNRQAQAKAKSDANYASQMTIDDYIEWLEDWDSMSFLQGATEFINLYIGNKAGSSTPKKEDAQLNAR